MGLSLVTAPSSEPITRAEAKAHLRVDDTDSDDYIDRLIARARAYVERETRRALVSQTWDYTLDRFPAGEIRLPIQPVTSVSYVHYVNTAGSTVSYADTSTSPETPYWTLITDRPRAVVIPNYNLVWPDTRDHGNAVTVRFVAGYALGASPSDLPPDIRGALELLIGHWFENREDVVLGATPTSIPHGVTALLSPYILRGF